MKSLLTMAIILFATTSKAMMDSSLSNMGTEQSLRKNNSVNSSNSLQDSNSDISPTATYRNEYVGKRASDSISTGQSATKRNDMNARTIPITPISSKPCVDSSGFAYYKNDSGYATCVSQRSSLKK